MGGGGLSPLQSQGAVGMAPRLQGFGSPNEECSYLAHQISGLLREGVRPSRIAVLYRVNGQSEPMEAALASAQIGYQLKGGVRFFARPEIQTAMRTLRAELIAKSDKPTHQILDEICRGLGWSTRAPEVAGAAREKWESLNALMEIQDEMPSGISAQEFYTELEERAKSQHEPEAAAITLATIHAAKGLEWDHVFLMGVQEGYLPISYAKTETEVAEENRLLYVGVTRAKKSLMISWSGTASRFVKLLQAQS
jgi:DNA helicase-2/ATP-dependent DNA helicase PcrA